MVTRAAFLCLAGSVRPLSQQGSLGERYDRSRIRRRIGFF